MAIRWPDIVDALVALLPTLPGYEDVTVADGPPLTQARPPRYVTVGYVADEDAGAFEIDRRNDYRVEERGTVRCHFVAQSGSTKLPAYRDEVFALVDELDQALRADQTLGGVLSADGTCVLSGDIQSVQNAKGTAQSVVVTVEYVTRT